MYSLLGEGIFTQDGQAWKHSREMLRRQFVRMQYQNLRGFDEPVNNLLASLSGSSGVVDLQPLFFRFTLATTTTLIFGESIRSLGDEEEKEFSESFDYASLICAIKLRLTDFHWAYTPKKFTKACRIVKRYADHFVDSALKDRQENGEQPVSDRYAFIHDLYDELKDRAMVRDQLVHVLIAGRDTTACLMSWTL